MSAIADLQANLKSAFGGTTKASVAPSLRADDALRGSFDARSGHDRRPREQGLPALDIAARTDLGPVVRFGGWSVGTALVLFLVWATLFPLSSAIIAFGSLVADGRNLAVQHPRGGRVVAVHVREGDGVRRGDAILTLDEAETRAELTRLEARHVSLSALRHRLDAERKGRPFAAAAATAPAPAMPLRLRGSQNRRGGARDAELVTGSLRLGSGGRFQSPAPARSVTTVAVSPPPFDEAADSQRVAYLASQALLSRQLEGLTRKIETLSRQRQGVDTRRAAQERLLAMARRERDRLRPLARSGYVARNRMADRERAVLELEASMAGLRQEANGLADQIREVRSEMERVRAAATDGAAKEYARVVGELAEITDQLSAARAAVGATVVRAPGDGRFVQHVALAPGTVVGSAEKVAEVVPQNAFLVEARIQPADVDHVRSGQEAEVVVTAFDRRMDDPLPARVVFRSADTVADERTGERYFTVRLAVRSDAARAADLRAGMQAEVYIATGGRTFMAYLLAPLTDSLRKAFRER